VESFNSGYETVRKGSVQGACQQPICCQLCSVSHIIKKNRCITTDKLQLATSHCHATIHAIIHKDLKMKKVCAHWVPRDLMPEQKERRVQNCHELLAVHHKDPVGFFARPVTSDESWLHYRTPDMKRQSMQWKHDDSPHPKKFQTAPSAAK
jgi:histone-lysine N-methyltransferase SETMAR